MEIKPCIFCGKIPKLSINNWLVSSSYKMRPSKKPNCVVLSDFKTCNQHFEVMCCHNATGLKESKSEAISEWNKRFDNAIRTLNTLSPQD